MGRAWTCLATVVLGVLLASVGAFGQEVGPERVIDVIVPVVPVGTEQDPTTVATGVVELAEGCSYCLVGPVQYRITLPEGVARLVIELVNTSDPMGDIDLIIREGTPVTEDELSYYYSFRTYGTTGEERIELPEEGIEAIPAGEYYVGIVSFVAPGDAYELRAVAFVEESVPDTILLEPNGPVNARLEPGRVSGDLDPQYAYVVPTGAALVAIRAMAPQGDVDLLVGADPVVRDDDGRLLADIQLRSTGQNELLLIGDPDPGELWIVVENDSPASISYTLTATSLPAIEDLDLGLPVAASVGWEGGLVPALFDYLGTDDGMLGLTQYRVGVPEGLEAMRVRLEGSDVCDIRIHLRYGEPVFVVGGTVVADLSLAESPGVAFLLQEAFIQQGAALYIALERLGEGEKAFSLVAERAGSGE